MRRRKFLRVLGAAAAIAAAPSIVLPSAAKTECPEAHFILPKGAKVYWIPLDKQGRTKEPIYLGTAL